MLVAETTAGCYLLEISFRPTFNKWEGEICRGFMIHVLDPHIYRPYFTTIALLRAILETDPHREKFEWKKPPYEYECEKMPIDMILGDPSLRNEIEEGVNLLQIKESWLPGLKNFLEWREPYLLYT